MLGIETKSLLVGEAADPVIKADAIAVAAAHPKIDRVLNVITMQQGPGEVVVALKLLMVEGLTGREVVDAINEFEVTLQERRPEVRWCFVEPDIE